MEKKTDAQEAFDELVNVYGAEAIIAAIKASKIKIHPDGGGGDGDADADDGIGGLIDGPNDV